MERVRLTRRAFLQVGLAAGGGLLVAFPWLPAAAGREEAAGFSPNAWLTVHPDGRVQLRVASSEMGQGVLTGIAMLIAEELDADWSRVTAEEAPVDPAFANPLMGRQQTGGSTAIRGFWRVAREAGAVARELLVEAAARRWGVDPGACVARQGRVVHEPTGRHLDYGALAAEAARLPVPETVFLKEPEEFTLIGRPQPRLDTPAKVDGSARFGLDVRLPGMLTAVVARSPTLGGRLRRYDDRKARSVPGVRAVFAIDSGVAVLADHFWAAQQGRAALDVDWDPGPHAGLDSAAIERQFEQALARGGVTERVQGDPDAALRSATRRVEAVYRVPFQAHACMEPMNATADVRADGCDLYLPTQAQTASQETAMRLTGLPRERVRVHTTFLGGGFGRRSEQDFVREAVECARRAGRPVKVVWTREDDLTHDLYRPATLNALRGAVDDDGRIVAWEHRIAGPSILARVAPGRVRDGRDPTSTEGAANLPYAIPHLRVRYAMVNTPVPVGFWRSVGSSQNAYVTECFFDELARAAGRDPLDARLELLGGHPRHRRTLELAADKAGWGRALPEGRARGLAVAESFGSVVAQVAEVSVDEGQVRVHRVVCAVECGIAVNPDLIAQQMESGIVYGLTAALKSAVTVRDGRIEQRNFDTFPLLRLDECPEIAVHIVPSSEPPGGIGEPGVPPVAPAVANAVFALTGRPARSLPIRLAR
ncbi:MAG TPA: xanthine dehydrogenase family protein molybdopterin-binding subunit [Chromatiales bacterium]|nr:xanthine dehydrogenase family protein molybdopterin-binding subunit [Chromatiales bacterium]